MNEALEGMALHTATLSLDRESPDSLFYASGWACTLVVEWFENAVYKQLHL